jgi:Uma2 family endonuclease
MGMPNIRRRWTVAQVRSLLGESRPSPRYELIDGELLVTPSPSPVHQRAVRVLMRVLDDYCAAQSIGEVHHSPADLSLDGESIVQPDLFIVPAATPPLLRDWSAVRSLVLAVEVLSPGSVRHDRVTKRRFFQRVGVPEYWIVDVDARTVERWRPFEVSPVVTEARLEWRPAGAAEALVIDLMRLFRKVWREQE